MSTICWQNSRRKNTGSLLPSRLCFYQLLANLLACESWGTGDFCSCKTIAAPKPGISASCECAGGCNLHELQGSRSRSVCACVCHCFPACHFNLHSLPEEQQLSNEWQLPPGIEKGGWPLVTGPATLLVWDLLTGLWGNSSYMWNTFYLHQRENKGLSGYKCTITAKWAKAAKALSCPLSF